jgi:predicted dehydrogenase
VREALELPGVDVVAVATPPLSHAPTVHEAVAAGKHVVCEKPFARDVGEARGMLAAAEQAGVVHVLGTEFRFDAPQALLNRVLREGIIGTPRPTPVPPPAVLLTTPYEMWHSTGNEVIPYASLYRAMRARIAGEPPAPDPVLPTFVDGVALQLLHDAILRSSAEHRTVMVERV